MLNTFFFCISNCFHGKLSYLFRIIPSIPILLFLKGKLCIFAWGLIFRDWTTLTIIEYIFTDDIIFNNNLSNDKSPFFNSHLFKNTSEFVKINNGILWPQSTCYKIINFCELWKNHVRSEIIIMVVIQSHLLVI